MTGPVDRRLGLLEALFPPLAKPSSEAAKQDEWLWSLTMPTLHFLNRLYRWREDRWREGAQVDGALLVCEVERLNELDRQGLLPDLWWSRHEPLTEPRLRGDPEPEPAPYDPPSEPEPQSLPRGNVSEPAPDLEPRAPAREAESPGRFGLMPVGPEIWAPIASMPDVPRVVDFGSRRRRR